MRGTVYENIHVHIDIVCGLQIVSDISVWHSLERLPLYDSLLSSSFPLLLLSSPLRDEQHQHSGGNWSESKPTARLSVPELQGHVHRRAAQIGGQLGQGCYEPVTGQERLQAPTTSGASGSQLRRKTLSLKNSDITVEFEVTIPD